MAPKRILLVDDEPEVFTILAGILRRQGYAVDVASSAAEASRYLGEYRYSLVISDWQLGDGDGVQIADAAADAGAQTAIISGYLFELWGEAAKRHITIMKPIDFHHLLYRVEKMTEQI